VRRGWALACALLAGCATPAKHHAGLPATPHREPGLWRTHVVFDGGSYPIPEAFMCLDDASERRLTLVGAQMNREHCTTYELTPASKGVWSFRSVCKLNGRGEMTTVATVRGDFHRAYTVDSESVVSGSGSPQSDGRHHFTVEGERVGPCPAGQIGGDFTSNGRTIRLIDDTAQSR
jgi:hypothetical protein